MERPIKLYTGDNPKTSPRFLNVEWPPGETLFWAELSTSSRIAAGVDSDFVISNIPSGHRVLFAATSKNGHEAMITMLAKPGDSFEIRTSGPTVVARNHFMRRIFGRKEDVKTLFGSTQRAEVVEKILENYFLDWGSSYVFPFLIAKDEPADWQRKVENLIGLPPRLVHQDLIRKCHCIMTTTWDHGMIFLSDKVPKAEVEKITREIASKHQVEMRLMT